MPEGRRHVECTASNTNYDGQCTVPDSAEGEVEKIDARTMEPHGPLVAAIRIRDVWWEN